MKANILFGYMCPKCRISSVVNFSFGAGNCGKCGEKLVPTQGDPQADAIANATCNKCGKHVGLVVSPCGPAKCRCGGEFV